jgi:hypothetical protein
VFANCKVRAEEPEPVLHPRQQFADLVIGAPFQTLPQFCPNPKCFKSFNQIVRSSQLPLIFEQFPDGRLVLRQVLQIPLYPQYTKHRGKLTRNALIFLKKLSSKVVNSPLGSVFYG